MQLRPNEIRDALAATPALGPGEIGLWEMRAVEDGPLAALCRSVLQPGERERMERMRSACARSEFLIGRGVLRLLLGCELHCDPRSVAIRKGADGKPFVVGIEFNVAHSRGQLLIALCREAAVGVDLEWIDAEIEAQDVAVANFAANEVDSIRKAGSAQQQAAAFYRCWTKKEAVMKAHGAGLTLPLKEVIVPMHEADERLVQVGERTLFVREVETAAGFMAALAAGVPSLRVVRRDVSDALGSVMQHSGSAISEPFRSWTPAQTA